ncbi:MAG TPA: RNA-binding protein, partial [Terriglobia bacterium]|nr:RNA-binding protein [Terriglobia bacterium]
MTVTLILKRGHGSVLNVVIYTPSSIGKSESNPRRRLKPRNLQSIRASIAVQEAKKMSKLFFVNIPYNCSDRELQEWVESGGFETRSIRIVRDLVAGVSPAFGYVQLRDDTQMHEAINILNGKRMRNQIILVKEAQVQ